MEEWKGYLDALASKAPVPGGGGASAVGGALGAALGQMVGSLTAGKKKYAEWEPGIQREIGQLERSRARFLALAKEDEEVFEPLSKAYGIKAETEEEKREKAEYMELCLCAAADVPLKIMEECVSAMEPVEFLALHGSRLAVSDAGVGIQFLRAALLGAVMNVHINTKMMQNRERAAELTERTERLLETGIRRADSIYEIVLKAVKG